MLVPSQRAAAFCRLTTKKPKVNDTCAGQGLGLRWERSCLSFTVLDRARTEPPIERVRDVIDHSFATWSNVECDAGRVGLRARETSALGQCAAPEYNSREGNANTVIFIDDWADRELPEDAFGLTLVWHNGTTGEIYDADIQLNETIGPFAICEHGCPDGAVDLENVVTHEVGHFFGLGHSRVKSATMSARATIGETSKRDLAADDRNGLCAIYAERPEPTCSEDDFTPNHGFSPLCWPGDDDDVARATCQVAAVGAASAGGVVSASGASGASLLLLGAWFARRRQRARVAKSSSSPSETSK
jgi:hypothetical protein